MATKRKVVLLHALEGPQGPPGDKGPTGDAGSISTVTIDLSNYQLTANNSMFAGSGLTTASTSGSVLIGTNNSLGLSLGIPKWLTTATSGASLPGASALMQSMIHIVGVQRAAMVGYRHFGRTVSNGSDQPFFIQGGVLTVQSAAAPQYLVMSDVKTLAGNVAPYFNFERRGSAMYV